jgi:hypothetical protein
MAGSFNQDSYPSSPTTVAQERMFKPLSTIVLSPSVAGTLELIASGVGTKCHIWGFSSANASSAQNSVFFGSVQHNGVMIFPFTGNRNGPMMVRWEIPIELDLDVDGVDLVTSQKGSGDRFTLYYTTLND